VTYLAVSIGIPDDEQAQELSRTLVEERIVAGTRISSGLSHYRWEGSVEQRRYWTVIGFTTDDNLERLYDCVDGFTDDDLPGVTYTEIGAHEEYLAWIDSETQ